MVEERFNNCKNYQCNVQNVPIVSLNKKRYPYSLVLIASRNGFEREFTIKLSWIEGLMVDSNLDNVKAQIRTLLMPETYILELEHPNCEAVAFTLYLKDFTVAKTQSTNGQWRVCFWRLVSKVFA